MSNWNYCGDVNWLLESRELHGKTIKNWCSSWRKISGASLTGRTGTYRTADTCRQKPPRPELPIIVYRACSVLALLWVMHQPNAARRWPLFMETTSFVMQYISQSLMDWLKIKYRCCYCKQIPSVPQSRSEVDCWTNHWRKLQMNYLSMYKLANAGFNCYKYEEMFSECEECTFDTSWQSHKST